MKQAATKKIVLFTIILMDLLVGMEFDLFVPSFPELQRDFNLSASWVEALLSFNFIGYAISLFFVGSLADHYGRKPIILIGLVIFIIGSIFCIWAPSFYILLAGRFLQGIGVAAPSILSFLIIADTYPIAKQQYLLAILNGIMNASIAAAPVIGSYITLYFSWQGNFTALFLLGILVLIMTLIFVPHYKLSKKHETVSFAGYVPILKSKPLMLLIANIVLIFVPYWIFVGMSPLLFMEDLGVDLKHFGYYQGSLALVFALGSVTYGQIMGRFNQKNMLVVSNLTFIFSMIVIGMVTILDGLHPVFITLSLLPFTIAQIIPTTILYPIALNYLPHLKGQVSAVMQGTRLIVSSLALQIAGYFYADSFRNIGIIILCFLLFIIITLYYVIRNPSLITKVHAIDAKNIHAKH